MVETVKPHIILSEKIIRKVYKNNRGYWLLDKDGNNYIIDEDTYFKLEGKQWN